VRYIWLRRAYLGLRSETRALRPTGSASVHCWRKCEVGTASSDAEFEGEAENIFAYSVLLSLDAIPQYCFEFVFERSRRNSKCTKPGQAFGGRGVDLHKFDLIAGEWRLR
jgi:hypothetical protein